MKNFVDRLLGDIAEKVLLDAVSGNKEWEQSEHNIGISAVHMEDLRRKALDKAEKRGLSIGDAENMCANLIGTYRVQEILRNYDKREFAARLDRIFWMMGEAGVAMDISMLCKEFEDSVANEIWQHYKTDWKVTKENAGIVAETLGVNRHYLVGDTDEHPFKSNLVLIDGVGRFVRDLDLIDNRSISVIFTKNRAKGTVDQFLFVNIVNSCRMTCYDGHWYFYSETGAHGDSQLKMIYSVIRQLKMNGKLSDEDYLVDEDLFTKVCQGDVYVGDIVKNREYRWLGSSFSTLVESVEVPDGASAELWQRDYESSFSGIRQFLLDHRDEIDEI